MFPGSSGAHRRFRLLDDQDQTEFTHTFEVHTLELAKLPEDPAQLSAPFEIWGDFLRRAAKLDPEKLPPDFDRPILRSALEELDMLSRDEIERERYENRLKVMLDELSRATYAQQMVEKAAEAQRQLQAAQRQLQESEQQLQESERQLQNSERQRHESERQLHESERQRTDSERRRTELERQTTELEQRIAAAEQQSWDAVKQRLQFAARLLRVSNAQQEAWMSLPLEQMQAKVESLEGEIVREWGKR